MICNWWLQPLYNVTTGDLSLLYFALQLEVSFFLTSLPLYCIILLPSFMLLDQNKHFFLTPKQMTPDLTWVSLSPLCNLIDIFLFSELYLGQVSPWGTFEATGRYWKLLAWIGLVCWFWVVKLGRDSRRGKYSLFQDSQVHSSLWSIHEHNFKK
jgi:hypothetical protein